MIIVGAKGLAKEVLEIFHEKGETNNLYFYDDISTDLPEKLYSKFPIIRSLQEAKKVLQADQEYTLGLGDPQLRYSLDKKFSEIGGVLARCISANARIGSFGTVIEEGVTVLMGAVITNGVYIHKCVLVNPNCTISHDTTIGEYAEISPGAQITGSVTIGAFTKIGTNATILPKVKIGTNCIIGAGSVITKDVPDNAVVVGVPGRIIRVNE